MISVGDWEFRYELAGFLAEHCKTKQDVSDSMTMMLILDMDNSVVLDMLQRKADKLGV